MTSHIAGSVRPLFSSDGGGVPGELHGSTEGDGEMGSAYGAATIAEDDQLDVAARKPKVPRRPEAPAKNVRQAHELHHADYRDWRIHCQAGK